MHDELRTAASDGSRPDAAAVPRVGARRVEPAPERIGTQSLARGIKLLRVIASRPQFGWRLSDLSATCGLDKGTVRRMLVCLVEERLVVQNAGDRRYFPGPLLFELGLALPDIARFHRTVEDPLRAFARRTGGVALLLLRSGNEFVCSLRQGSLQHSGSLIVPGTRRPLFTSAGGVAILLTMPRDEATQVLRENIRQEVAKQGTGRLAGLRRMRQCSAEHGFGVSFGDVVPGVHAFGMPVSEPGRGAFAALTLIGTPQRCGPERLDDLRAELEVTARLISIASGGDESGRRFPAGVGGAFPAARRPGRPTARAANPSTFKEPHHAHRFQNPAAVPRLGPIKSQLARPAPAPAAALGSAARRDPSATSCPQLTEDCSAHRFVDLMRNGSNRRPLSSLTLNCGGEAARKSDPTVESSLEHAP